MTAAVPYVTSATLRDIVRESDETVDECATGPTAELARRVGESARVELTRRSLCDHCEVCGWDDCQCDNGHRRSVVFVDGTKDGANVVGLDAWAEGAA